MSILSLEDDSVLNVRVKYAGGVAAYFNGGLVERFNLEDELRREHGGYPASRRQSLPHRPLLRG